MATKRKASALSSSTTTTTIENEAPSATAHDNDTRTPPAKNLRPSPPSKLPRLPKNASITKRPLLHPPIPSPHTGPLSPKTVYISTRTPFHSAIKRVETLFRKIELRERQSSLHRRHGHGKKGMGRLTEDVNSTSSGKGAGGRDDPILRQALAELATEGREGKGGEKVFVKATGRAIEKALDVACWFMRKEGKYVVRVKTGTVSAIDDVEIVRPRRRKRVWEVDGDEGEVEMGEDHGDGDAEDGEREGKADTEDIPETRIRQTNVLEVAIGLA